MSKRRKINLVPMIKNQIVLAPNPILSRRTKPLTEDNYIKITNKFVKRGMKHRKGAIGIAANQIHMPYRIFIAQLTQGVWKVFINPTIPQTSKSKFFNSKLIVDVEGCLSLPDSVHSVARKEQVEVVYRDINWEPQIGQYKGLAARIVQHEIDHLNGILIDKNMDERL